MEIGAENLGMYGRAVLENLRDIHPTEFKRLRSRGELQAHLEEIEDQANLRHEEIVEQLRREAPKPADHQASIHQHQEFERTARDLVLKEILRPDAETQAAELTGYLG